MRRFWGWLKDWQMGKKCPIHGTRPSEFLHGCATCWLIERRKEAAVRHHAEREAKIEIVAEGVRRAHQRLAQDIGHRKEELNDARRNTPGI